MWDRNCIGHRRQARFSSGKIRGSCSRDHSLIFTIVIFSSAWNDRIPKLFVRKYLKFFLYKMSWTIHILYFSGSSEMWLSIFFFPFFFLLFIYLFLFLFIKSTFNNYNKLHFINQPFHQHFHTVFYYSISTLTLALSNM